MLVYLFGYNTTLPWVTKIAFACIGPILGIGSLWWHERTDVYDAADIFLEYEGDRPEHIQQAHLDWVKDHPTVLVDYSGRFVAVHIASSEVVCSCRHVDDFVDFLDGLSCEERDAVFAFHVDMFEPK